MSSAQEVGGEGRLQEGLRLSGWRPAGDQRAREDFLRGGMNVTWFTPWKGRSVGKRAVEGPCKGPGATRGACLGLWEGPVWDVQGKQNGRDSGTD